MNASHCLMVANFCLKNDPAFRSIDNSYVKLLIFKDIAANKQYPYTLEKYMNEYGCQKKIPIKLQRAINEKIIALHQLGFYHGDLHHRNIVLDVIKSNFDNQDDYDYEVRLIDFETLRTMEELQRDPDQVRIMYEFLGVDQNPEYECTLEDLIKFEINNAIMNYNI